MFVKTPCDEGVIRAGRCAGAGAPARGWILATTILGSSMAFIDGTVVNVGLPALQRGLGARVSDVQWVIEAYTLLFSSLLLVGGSLGDHYGRRRIYAIGIVVFTLTSALCGIAADVRMLILARALQGVGAALLVPGSLAIIAASFPQGERGRAIGTWSAFSAATTSLGPMLGGWLVDHAGWRWIFFVNLPIAIGALVLLLLHVPESRDPGAPSRIDLPGAMLATLGLGGTVYGLIEGPSGWSQPRVIVALVVGIAALLAFVAVEARGRAPMVPLGLFRSRTFAGSNLLTAALYAALAMIFFVLPFDLIRVHGWSATAAGSAGLPMVVVLFLMSRWSGSLMDRTGPRLPLVLGPAIAGLGFAMFALPGVGAGGWLSTLAPMVVLGVGMGLTVTPLTTTVMNAVDVSHAGIASGINNAVSRASGLIAVAAIGAPLQAMASASSSGFRGVALAAGGLALISAAVAAGTLESPRAPEQRAAA